MKTTSITTDSNAVISKVRDIAALFKLRLASLVVVSAVLGYYMGAATTEWVKMLALCLGGFLLTGGSNGMNQVLERRWDALMNRTAVRPIPSGKMSHVEATILSILAATAGIVLLWWLVNQACGILGLCAFFMYVFLYTPLKRVTSLAVFVGAFPGAIPPMLGYVAATNNYGLEAGLLFAMQFMWQFPHFWSIAWVSHEDYKRGGYDLLPFRGGPSKRNAFQIFLYSAFLIPVSLLPWALPVQQPMMGNVALAVAVICGLIMLLFSMRLYRTSDTRDARKVMFTSFFYLPVVQLFYVLDRLQ
ncbi:MAG: heme o synthase [Flavobacteriales bacterium]